MHWLNEVSVPFTALLRGDPPARRNHCLCTMRLEACATRLERPVHVLPKHVEAQDYEQGHEAQGKHSLHADVNHRQRVQRASFSEACQLAFSTSENSKLINPVEAHQSDADGMNEVQFSRKRAKTKS